MRITQHNSRKNSSGGTLGTIHNDRQYDISKADNILNDGSENIYLARYAGQWVYDGSISFDAAERDFYQQYLSEDLKQQNERAIRARHKERVQDIDQYRQSRKHCPEERILQIGNSETGAADPETLRKCVEEYTREIVKASRGRFKVLDLAIHNDEAVPHCHLRGVWVYQGEDGHLHTGQEKALEQIGYKPFCMREGKENDSRYCNRKIAFDYVMRERWLDICERNGVKVEREPIPDAHHNMSKEDMIREKYSDALDIIAKAERLRDVMEREELQPIFHFYPDRIQKGTRDALDRLNDELER